MKVSKAQGAYLIPCRCYHGKGEYSGCGCQMQPAAAAPVKHHIDDFKYRHTENHIPERQRWIAVKCPIIIRNTVIPVQFQNLSLILLRSCRITDAYSRPYTAAVHTIRSTPFAVAPSARRYTPAREYRQLPLMNRSRAVPSLPKDFTSR